MKKDSLYTKTGPSGATISLVLEKPDGLSKPIAISIYKSGDGWSDDGKPDASHFVVELIGGGREKRWDSVEKFVEDCFA